MQNYVVLSLSVWLGLASHARAQTPPVFTTIYNFTGPPFNSLCPLEPCAGSGPTGLVMGSGGILYGGTDSGGYDNAGTFFSLTPPATAGAMWTETVISPQGPGPAVASGGVLYFESSPGSCSYSVYGGEPPPSDCGDLSWAEPPATPGGAWTDGEIYVFPIGGGPQWANPSPDPGIAIGPGGIVYGAADNYEGVGFVFSLAPPATPGGPWTQSILYRFPSPDYGESGVVLSGGPNNAPVLYVVAYNQGESYSVPAKILSLSPTGPGGAWTATALYTTASGETIEGNLAVGPGGVLYGTGYTGISCNGCVPTAGEVFSLTPPLESGGTWTKATLYTFPSSVTLGGLLTIGSRGVLYGATSSTVFSLAPPAAPGGAWTETTLHNFTGGADGGIPSPQFAIGSDGTLYGTTYKGGSAGVGTAFAIKIPVPEPSINPGGLVSAASYQAPVAPGSIASVFGSFFVSSLGATQSPLPASLSGLSLQFDFGPPAPLFFASAGQVNFQVPWELAFQSQVNLAATLNGQTGAAQTVNLAPFAPAIFTINATGSGQGAILDASNHLVDASNPASPGSTVVQIFCTGLGAVSNQPQTGSPAPLSPLAYTGVIPTVTIGGVPAGVSFSGLAPGYVGLYQVNALLPAGLEPGSAVPVVISMEGISSNTVTIAVK